MQRLAVLAGSIGSRRWLCSGHPQPWVPVAIFASLFTKSSRRQIASKLGGVGGVQVLWYANQFCSMSVCDYGPSHSFVEGQLPEWQRAEPVVEVT